MDAMDTGEGFCIVNMVTPKDGVYPGKWSGYSVVMEYNGDVLRFSTTNGIQAMNVPVSVTISKGRATIQLRQQGS